MTPAGLIDRASARLGASPALVASRQRGKGPERVRFAVAWILRQQPKPATYLAIGRHLARSPSTARHACGRAEQMRLEDFDFRQATDHLLAVFSAAKAHLNAAGDEPHRSCING